MCFKESPDQIVYKPSMPVAFKIVSAIAGRIDLSL